MGGTCGYCARDPGRPEPTALWEPTGSIASEYMETLVHWKVGAQGWISGHKTLGLTPNWLGMALHTPFP